MCKCIYIIHVIAINEKLGHDFERTQRGIYGRVWREKRERKSDALSFKKTEIIKNVLKCR